MAQEQKQLLWVDLCARWMTDLKCVPNTKNSTVAYCTVDGIKRDIKGGLFIELTDRDTDGNALASTSTNELDMVKPYLRPMSSMTEEESKEFALLQTDFYVDGFLYPIAAINMINWLISHYFDYYGLIPLGLASEAPEGMYKIDLVYQQETLGAHLRNLLSPYKSWRYRLAERIQEIH